MRRACLVVPRTQYSWQLMQVKLLNIRVSLNGTVRERARVRHAKAERCSFAEPGCQMVFDKLWKVT